MIRIEKGGEAHPVQDEGGCPIHVQFLLVRVGDECEDQGQLVLDGDPDLALQRLHLRVEGRVGHGGVEAHQARPASETACSSASPPSPRCTFRRPWARARTLPQHLSREPFAVWKRQELSKLPTAKKEKSEHNFAHQGLPHVWRRGGAGGGLRGKKFLLFALMCSNSVQLPSP